MPRVRWTRTPSPSMEKPHATNPLCVEGEGGATRRPRSMMLLRGGGGGGGASGGTPTLDDDR